MTSRSIDLILIGGNSTDPIAWPLGRTWSCEATPQSLAATVSGLPLDAGACGFLFWDSSLGAPSPDTAQMLSLRSEQVVHAGLMVGMSGLPEALDFVSPTWMLNADADASIESTSWRLTWRACWIPAEVLRQCGGPLPAFQSLEGAALEWGYRLAKSGVVLRYVPAMLPSPPHNAEIKLALEDEMRFLRLRMSGLWSRYALVRMILSAFREPFALLEAWRRAGQHARIPASAKYVHRRTAKGWPSARVSVLIPTVDRYSYLRTIVSQLQTQTVPPFEIIVVDQTHVSRRDSSVNSIPSVCPLRVIYLDEPGQCRARNAGLNIAKGDYVLFVDDDDEIEGDLLERHLQCLAHFDADVSAGVADEAGAGPLPDGFTFLRLSDVFPTNNCMIRTSVLERSGLFDLAYDRGARADGDLGMRIYLSGALMILNPSISVFHHHAPVGGLRAHKARKITYARSRTSIMHRHLPSATEAYLCGRYFSSRQVREEIWLRALGTLAIRGGVARKLAKLAIGILFLPHTCWRITKSLQAAREMRKVHPTIPSLIPATTSVTKS